MGILARDQEKLNAFFAAINSTRAAYQYSAFSYLAFRGAAGFEIVLGRLFVNVKESDIPFTHFTSQNVRAGHCRVGEIAKHEQDLFGKLIDNTLETPNGGLRFFSPTPLGVSYIPAHKEASATQSRVSVVTLSGQAISRPERDSELDWEIRAASTPFDGVRDLLLEYRLGSLSDLAIVEAIAYSIAMIDAASVVEGTAAKPALLLAGRLDEADAALATELCIRRESLRAAFCAARICLGGRRRASREVRELSEYRKVQWSIASQTTKVLLTTIIG